MAQGFAVWRRDKSFIWRLDAIKPTFVEAVSLFFELSNNNIPTRIQRILDKKYLDPELGIWMSDLEYVNWIKSIYIPENCGAPNPMNGIA